MRQKPQIEIILEKVSRPGGASNFELNEVAFRYSARISDLRKRGFEIETKQDPDVPAKWWFFMKGKNALKQAENKFEGQECKNDLFGFTGLRII